MPDSPKAREDAPSDGEAPSERLLALVEHGWCGPLPPPSALHRYDEIVPGGAARLLQMAEAERAHRFACETKSLEAENSEARLGLLLGGAQPVRTWLKSLDAADRIIIRKDIAAAEYGWPVGMPLCRALRDGLFEIRSDLAQGRTARVVFCTVRGHMVLLHGFIKKTQKTPKAALDLAIKRKKELKS